MPSFNIKPPILNHELGGLHPITQVKDFLLNLLKEVGFNEVDGPEIESEEYNFDMLNIKESHPARQMHDTFYIKSKTHEKFVLRTHTSPVQIRSLKKNKLPYLVCITDPTAGGITASFAMLGDIHFAEPGCLIAFAGKRVIQATVKEELSSDFQTSEFVEKHGFVDRIVERKDLKTEISLLLSILLKKDNAVNEKQINETSDNIEPLAKAAS